MADAFRNRMPPTRSRAGELWQSLKKSLATRSTVEPDIASRIAAGHGLIVLLVGSIGVWAATTPIAGAVVASGTVIVESNIKKVQHPTGGIVSALLAKNGDRVGAGDIVLSLDETQTRANLGITVSQLTQLIGRKARLVAERDQASAIQFPAALLAGGEAAAAIVEGERRLFEVRQAAKKGQIAQSEERIGQLQEEIKGLSAQRDAKEQEIELMREELERLEAMRKKELMPTTRILSAQRDLTRLKGEWGSLIAQMARARGQISEIQLQIIGIEQTMQTDASKELRESEGRIAELLERKVAAEDMLRRVHLTAPQAGIVHDLTVHTIGGVIAPGETVMLIVPNQDSLSIEVRISTTDIDQVAVGQEATLRFPALNQRTTPEVQGVVAWIGADLTKELQTNTVYFAARIPLKENPMGKLKLVPGMPVEAFIKAGDRTALSYLVKPVTDQFAKAFRER